MDHVEKTALSYWFPKLEAAELPVPRTKILHMPLAAQEDIWAAFDGNDGCGGAAKFCDELRAAAVDLGYPVFLRTDHTSGKHNWNRTCFVPDAASMAKHVFAIAEYSEICGMMGELPWETWVLREMLPTIPFGRCASYGDMPVCREFRFFVDAGVTRCSHPYWPRGALEKGAVDVSLDYAELCRMPDEAALRALAEAGGRAVGGSWSVDLLETRNGWFITDMAEASKSFHWEGCEHAAVARSAA